MYSRRNAKKGLTPNKAMYMHRHLGSSTCWTRRHSMHTKTRKKSRDFPWWPVSPSLTTVGVVTPGPDLSRGRRTLSGTPRPDAQVHRTTGAAASPVRASLDRPLAKPRAQDQDEDQKTSQEELSRRKTRRQELRDSDEDQEDRNSGTLKTTGTQELLKVRTVRLL